MNFKKCSTLRVKQCKRKKSVLCETESILSFQELSASLTRSQKECERACERVSELEKCEEAPAHDDDEWERMRKAVRDAENKADEAEYRHQMASRQMRREKTQVGIHPLRFLIT